MAGTPFHNTVSLRGFHFEDFSLTWKLTSGMTANDVGKAVAISTANGVNSTVKLAGDNDKIIGRLATFEDRVQEGILTGAVEHKFSNTLPIKSGETVLVGSTVIGAGSGEVKPMANAAVDYTDNYVAEVVGNFAVVVKL